MKDGVSAQARNEKLRQVQSVSAKQSIVFRVLSIVAPGSGHIGAGMPFIGVALLFVWVVSACAILFDGVYALPDGDAHSRPQKNCYFLDCMIAEPRA